MKIILPLLIASVFASGCVADSGSTGEIKYKGLDGITKTLDTSGKSFQQICGETFGTWMTAEDGMSETRNGRPAGEPCSGCMTDSSNMFCSQDGYINAIKVR